MLAARLWVPRRAEVSFPLVLMILGVRVRQDCMRAETECRGGSARGLWRSDAIGDEEISGHLGFALIRWRFGADSVRSCSEMLHSAHQPLKPFAARRSSAGGEHGCVVLALYLVAVVHMC
jgi:hypothetical protein